MSPGGSSASTKLHCIVDVLRQQRAIEIAERYAESKYWPVEVRRLIFCPG